jgi:phosphoglucosamine mutase
MARMFGTDGIRGIANIAPISPEMVLALGQAAVRVLASTVSNVKAYFVVGRDTRLSSPMLEAALTAGLCSAGANVLSVGVMPTAGVAYLTRALGAIAGVMISASHNPYMDNGIKFFSSDGMKLDDHLEDAIEIRLQDMAAERPTGAAVGTFLSYEMPEQRYINFLMATYHHQVPASLRIGLDCANGAASAIAPVLFAQLATHVRVWHATPDGLNINQQCGALHPEFLQQKVLDEGLDLGFAFDGDADRLIVIDHTGSILDGDYILAICAQTLLRNVAASDRVVVSTVMANLGLDQALQKMGITLYKTQVGDKYVMQAMRQHRAIVGGEQSGHVIFLQHHTTGDGLLTAIQLLNAVRDQQTTLAELAQIMCKFPQVLVNVKLARRDDPLQFPQIQEAVRSAEDVLGMHGRVLVRLSGTEFVARVMVEGQDRALIASLAQRIAQVITRELGDV